MRRLGIASRLSPEEVVRRSKRKRAPRALVGRDSARARRLRKKYGVSTGDYVGMSAAQGHACAMCGDESEALLAVDHCHASGKVRGLLCNACNRGIGLLRDRPELGAAYLAKFQAESEIIDFGRELEQIAA